MLKAHNWEQLYEMYLITKFAFLLAVNSVFSTVFKYILKSFSELKINSIYLRKVSGVSIVIIYLKKNGVLRKCFTTFDSVKKNICFI